MYTPTLNNIATSPATSEPNEELSQLTLTSLEKSPPLETPPETSLPKPSSHYSPGNSTSVEARALKLLGSGVGAEAVAGALGVTPSRISQLLAKEEFSKQVADLRYEALQSHNKRDDKYDSLEDKLLIKLEKSLPLLVKPEGIMKAIGVINGAKRRGQSAPEQVTNQQNIVNIILPTIIADKFTTNADNQVIKAGEQDLITMQSGNLLKQTEEVLAERGLRLEADKPENNL